MGRVVSVQEQPPSPQCQYRRLTNGIDEFTFLTNTRAAVDAYFACLEVYLNTVVQAEPGRTMRMLIILQQPGMPPLSYMMERYLAFIRVHHDRLPTTRVVYLYQKGVMLSPVRSFLGLITKRRHANRRFLPFNDRAQAEIWLLEDTSPPMNKP